MSSARPPRTFQRRHSPSSPPRPNALADIRYNANATYSDSNTASEDESKEPVLLYSPEHAQGVLGVSIGQAQTRLTNPNTPAAEKVAALEDIEGGGLFAEGWTSPTAEESDESQDRRDGTSTEEEQSPTEDRQPLPTPPKSADNVTGSQERFPSPWRAEPKTFQRADETKQTLRGFGRPRAWSGSASSASRRKLFPSLSKGQSFLAFNLPSFSSSSLVANDSASPRSPESKQQTGMNTPSATEDKRASWHAHTRRRTDAGDLKYLKRQSMVEPRASLAREATDSTARNSDGADQGPSDFKPQRPPLLAQHPALRRSSSYDSLVLNRSLSHASSLGDDTRFENVQKQLNVRVKAIRDSWQDASFKLPALPRASTFNLAPKGGSGTGSGPYGASSVSLRGKIHHKSMSSVTLNQPNQAGPSSRHSSSQSILNEVIKDLTGDVVILGGYRGSVLREAKPPHRQLWAPLKIGLNLRDVNLEVGLSPEDDELQEHRVIPGGMLKNIGPIDISRRLFKRLRHSENARNGKLRVMDFGYDWRLNPNLLSRKLIQFLETLKCNQPGTPPDQRGAIVMAHSLGGLITRHAVNQRPDLFSGVIFAGVPQTCVNILGPLRNGEDVLLSSRILTAQVNFTMRTSFALLPLDGRCFIDKNTKEEYPVDFFDVQTWIDYRLSPVFGPPLPPLNQPRSGGFGSIISSMASVLPNIPVPGRRGSLGKGSSKNSSTHSAKEPASKLRTNAETSVPTAPSMGQPSPRSNLSNGLQAESPLTAVSIPYSVAVNYLTQTLASVKQFKIELAHNEEHQKANAYPPMTVIYGKSIPTVYGAKVNGRDGIRRSDAYDDLAFASGDGVVLARASMLPEGYQAAKGGVISSDRGHIGLLGDLEAVGRSLRALVAARKKGVGCGLGPEMATETESR